jgi:D-alanyl-D-alanine carboxypeptidase
LLYFKSEAIIARNLINQLLHHKSIKNMKKISLGIIITLLSFSCVKSQKLIKKPLADKLEKQFQDILDKQQQSLNIPGISVAVILPDNSKWLGVSGKSSDNEKINSNMLFGLGSVTMTYTSTLIFQLEQEGLLSIDDTIGKFINALPEIDRSITIAQLLNHTSGLYRYQQKSDYLEIVFSQPNKIWASSELIETFQGEPECQPGKCWGESAMDHVMLGVIIEKIAGSTLSNQLQTKIFNPLNLEQTYLYPEQSYPVNNMAHFWWDNYGSSNPVDVLAGDTAKLPMSSLFSSVWAAGAIHSTAEDLAIFIKRLFEGELIEQKSLEKMLAPIAKVDKNIYYGYSVIIEQLKGKTVYWHTGGIGYSSIYCYFPNDKLSIAVLCNQMKDPKPIVISLYEAYKNIN